MGNTKAVLYLDIDGVVNFFGSRTAHRKHSKLGYLRRGTAVVGGTVFEHNWSAQLLQELNEIPALEIVLLSTWGDYSEILFDTLQWRATRVIKGASNNMLKFASIVRDQAERPLPFIWADDTATVSADALSCRDRGLILTPDEDLGLTLDDLEKIKEFVRAL